MYVYVYECVNEEHQITSSSLITHWRIFFSHLFFKIIHNAQLNEILHLRSPKRWTASSINMHPYLCTDIALKTTLYGNANYVICTELFECQLHSCYCKAYC